MACAPALIDVLLANASQVNAAEYRATSILLARLTQLDPVAVGSGYVRRERDVLGVPGSAYGVALARAMDPAQEISREDLLVFASNCLVHIYMWAKGFSEMVASTGIDELVYFTTHFYGGHPWLPGLTPSDDLGLRVFPMALNACRNSDGLSDWERAGMWTLVGLALCARAEVCGAAVRSGLHEAAVDSLRKLGPPADYVGWHGAAGLEASAITLSIAQASVSNPQGVNLPELLHQSGATEVFVQILQAFEQRGASYIPEVSVSTVQHVLFTLYPIDLEGGLGEPIGAMLRKVPSTLQFLLDHSLTHINFIHSSSASLAQIIICSLFGRSEEESKFTFTVDMVNSSLHHIKQGFSGSAAPWYQPTAHMCRPVLNLCVSDHNKTLLIQSPALIPLLLEMLLLDPTHQRQTDGTMPDAVKAAVQADAAECFMQIAVFEPQGRELLQGEAAAMDALRALAGGQAATSTAQISAHGALMAIQGKAALATSCDELYGAEEVESHVMMSYAWHCQVTITRIVRSLQSRGYRLWFDLDVSHCRPSLSAECSAESSEPAAAPLELQWQCMKGSTVDAMSDAVDNAAVMLFCVSLPYKESCNCRLEANYVRAPYVGAPT